MENESKPNLEIQETKDTLAQFESKMNNLEAQVGVTCTQLEKAREAYWATMTPSGSDPDLRIKYHGAEQGANNALKAYYETLKTEGTMPIARGTYNIQITYPARQRNEKDPSELTRSFTVDFYSKTITDLMSQIREKISMDGLHNFSLRVDSKATKMAPVKIAIDGNEISFKSTCWVNNGGHIVRELD